MGVVRMEVVVSPDSIEGERKKDRERKENNRERVCVCMCVVCVVVVMVIQVGWVNRRRDGSKRLSTIDVMALFL